MELFWLANYRCKTHFSSHSWQIICKKVTPEEFPFTNLLQFLSSFFPWFLYSDVQRGGLDLCRLKHEMSDFCKESCIYEICTDIFPLQYKKTKKEKKTKKRHNALFYSTYRGGWKFIAYALGEHDPGSAQDWSHLESPCAREYLHWQKYSAMPESIAHQPDGKVRRSWW